MKLRNSIKLFTVLLLFALFLIGCGTQDSEDEGNGQNESETSLEPVVVEVNAPESIELNEEVVIEAIVTQGDEAVSDADDVKFEIAKSGEEESEMIEAENNGDGTYSIKKTFDTEAVYTLLTHVDARGMHAMPPEMQLTVGNPAESHSHEDGDHSHGDNEESHEHGEEVTIDFNDEGPFSVNEETTLSALIEHVEEPLLGAEITFEIWQENTSQNEKTYLTAEEVADGKYEAVHEFTESAIYLITVHVEKDEIHEHMEKEITVE